MNNIAVASPPVVGKPTRVRYGVLAFACALSMITYFDRVCISSVMEFIQKDFNLSDIQKSCLYFGFTIAYAAFEIPSGWLGDMFGARRALLRIVVWWSIFTALTGLIYPSAEWPILIFTLLFLVRFFFGVGEAGAYPNIARAFHSWFPFEERGFAKGAVWMAGRLGGGLTPFVVFAMLYDTTGEDGTKIVHWRHLFWIFGGIGLVWAVFFAYWYRDRPDDKTGVNRAELALIHGVVHEEGTHALAAEHKPPSKVPWRKLFTNRNLWILCLMYFLGAYGWYFNITYLPAYLKDYYGVGYDRKWSPEFWRASLMTGLPLLMGSAACLIGGLLSDFFIRTTGNRKWGRRLFGVTGKGLCAVCYFCCIFTSSDWGIVWAVALAAFFNDLTMGAAWASCLDIGGKYSGIVAGCMNSVGNLGGALANLLTMQIVLWVTSWTSDLHKGDPGYLDATRLGWNCNFVVFSGVYLLAMLLWFWFDSTKQVAQE